MTRRNIFAALLYPLVGVEEIKEEPKKVVVTNLVIDEKTLEQIVDKAITRFLNTPITPSISCMTYNGITSGTYTTNLETVRVDEGTASKAVAG